MTDFKDFGPVTPFSREISAPSANIGDAPHYSLCVNEDWLPIIVGALKSLLNRQTWKETQTGQSLITIGQVQDLLDSITEGCPSDNAPPNWHYGFSVDQGTTVNFFERIEEEALTAGQVPTRTFVIMCTNDTSEVHAAEVDIWLLDENEDRCGAHIDQIVIIGHNGQNIIHASTIDCFDELFTKDFFLSWHLTDDFEDGKDLKSLGISALTDDLFVVIHGHGQFVCGIS